MLAIISKILKIQNQNFRVQKLKFRITPSVTWASSPERGITSSVFFVTHTLCVMLCCPSVAIVVNTPAFGLPSPGVGNFNYLWAVSHLYMYAAWGSPSAAPFTFVMPAAHFYTFVLAYSPLRDFICWGLNGMCQLLFMDLMVNTLAIKFYGNSERVQADNDRPNLHWRFYRDLWPGFLVGSWNGSWMSYSPWLSFL
jgi:hypothetical protein